MEIFTMGMQYYGILKYRQIQFLLGFLSMGNSSTQLDQILYLNPIPL